MQEVVGVCAMVAAYDSGSVRAHHTLIILDALLPLYLRQGYLYRISELFLAQSFRLKFIRAKY